MTDQFKVWTKEPTMVEGVRVEYLPFGTIGNDRPRGLHRHLRCKIGDFPWDGWEKRAIAADVGPELARLGRELMHEASEHITWSAKLYRECGWTDAEGADGNEGNRMIAFALRDPEGARKRWRHLLDTYGERRGRRTMPWQDFLLEQYEEIRPAYEDFGRLVATIITSLLAEEQLHVHSISARAKESASLRWKLESKAGNCSDLSHITDLAGIRVITYFPDDVDTVAAAIRKEFEIDWDNSIDKRTLLDPDRFGYLSLHYVMTLSRTRTDQAEFGRFAGLRAELQIRSILQHAWAEIEHDLGYKSHRALPQQVRRRFSRLAGLLELADAEFRDVRDTLKNYESTLKHGLATDPSSITIDQASLGAFIRVSEDVAALDAYLREHHGTVDAEALSRDFIDRLVNGLFLLGVQDMEELQAAIVAHRDLLNRFMRCTYHGSFKGIGFYPGASLNCLCYLLAIERGGRLGLEDWFNQMHDEPRFTPIDEYLACYESAKRATTRVFERNAERGDGPQRTVAEV
jgi:putative GTP pyrophosphokinase